MNRRSLQIAVAAASCTGLLAGWMPALLESIVRAGMGIGPCVEDSSARATRTLMAPVLIMGFPVFCWLYVLPMMRRLLGTFQMSGWQIPISAFLTAAIVWILFCVLLHSTRLDSITTTAMVIGEFVWWPVFAASCTMGYIIAGTVPAKKTKAENIKRSQ